MKKKFTTLAIAVCGSVASAAMTRDPHIVISSALIALGAAELAGKAIQEQECSPKPIALQAPQPTYVGHEVVEIAEFVLPKALRLKAKANRAWIYLLLQDGHVRGVLRVYSASSDWVLYVTEGADRTACTCVAEQFVDSRFGPEYSGSTRIV